LDDIPATAETWHLTGHVLKVNYSDITLSVTEFGFLGEREMFS